MKVLVTGGGGFVGKAVVRELVYQGHEVRSFARGDYPALREWGVDARRGDIGDFEAVDGAVDGVEAVFHIAAKAGVAGRYADYYRSNVIGTQNVIDACRRRGAGKLIFTSSPSVTFGGTDQEGEDEHARYPERYLAAYPQTKAIAERLVLEANGRELATVALRPHLIWGPGDTQLVPRVVSRAKAGRLRIVGTGEKLVDATYIDNVVDAHLLAAYRLLPDAPCAGRAYFITNGEPWPMAKILNGILRAAGLAPIEKTISEDAAYGIGAVLEKVWSVLHLPGEPPMTRFIARQLATAHWYDISAAKRDLDYEVQVSMDEGMTRLAESLRSRS
jgi:2-alkyl-3-oxoalkanoate reductase